MLSASQGQGNPNIGPFTCGGLVTLGSKTQQLTRSGQYWAFAHYSKAVRRGARVLATKGKIAGIDHVAFANPGGDYLLVLTNQGEERSINCQADVSVIGFDDIKAAAYTLPRLTTINQPLEEIGRIATQTLINRIHGTANYVDEIRVEPKLVVRESTGPVKA